MKGERTTENGFVLWNGEILTPPFTIRRSIDRVLLNEKQIFPLPELEEPVEETLFEAIEEDVTFGVEENTQDAITSALEEAKDFDPFLTFEEKAHRLMEYLDYREVKAERTEEYGDLIVPVEDEWGIMVAPNMEARIGLLKEAEAEVEERVLPFDAAAEFAEYFMGTLNEGGMLTLDQGIFSVTPPELIEQELRDLKGIAVSDVSDEEKIEKMTTFMSLPRSSGSKMLDTIQSVELEPSEGGSSLDDPRAVSFFPHLSWQRQVAGRYSVWPIRLLLLLRQCEGYKIRFYYDSGVTLRAWANELWNARRWDTRVIYNQGHGNRNVICVGTPNPKRGPWRYFNDAFVTRYARPGLPKTIVEIYSCLTLADNRLANAFLRRGACAYLGWIPPAPASPNYCDRFDERLWKTLVGLRATAGYAVEELYDKGIVTPTRFQLRGNWCCRV
jgi:hypothetical protein